MEIYKLFGCMEPDGEGGGAFAKIPEIWFFPMSSETKKIYRYTILFLFFSTNLINLEK